MDPGPDVRLTIQEKKKDGVSGTNCRRTPLLGVAGVGERDLDMRILPWAASAAALVTLAQPASAQTWSPSVNQRMDPPTSQSDGYVGVSLGQLIMALGISLKGAPPPGPDDVRIFQPRQTAAAPAPTNAGPAAAPQPESK